ncbi:MAG: HEAT repeat domain-containing protein [Terracidiphilus sp.]|jgi:hypothetical protein
MRHLTARNPLLALVIGLLLGAPAAAAQAPPTANAATYSFDYRSQSQTDFRSVLSHAGASEQSAPTPGMKNSFDVTTSGEVTVTVFDREGGSLLAEIRFAKLQLAYLVNGQPAAEAEKIRQELGQAIYTTMDAQDLVTSLQFQTGISRIAQTLARTLIARMQFVRPQESAQAHWQVEEEDQQGRYLAEYVRESTSAAGQSITKTILHYNAEQAARNQEAGTAWPEIATKGSFHLVAGEDSSLVSIAGEQSQSFTLRGQPVGNNVESLHFTRVARAALAQDKLVGIAVKYRQHQTELTRTTLSAQASRAEAEESIQRQALGSATFDSVAAELKQLEASGAGGKHTDLYLRVKALAALHPDACARLAQLVQATAPDGPAMKLVTGALAAAGTYAAQAALVEIMHGHADNEALQLRLLPALGLLQNPDVATVSELKRLSGEAVSERVSFRARLALGAAARALKQSAPERAAAIVTELLKQLTQARGPNVQRQYLLALGNTGAAGALPALKIYAASTDPSLRGAALSAMRFLVDGEAEEMLIAALGSDPESTVRLQAAEAISFRAMTPHSFDALKSALANDADSMVRLRAMSDLWEARDRFPQAVEAVTDASLHDASPEVRKAAGDLLAQPAR